MPVDKMVSSIFLFLVAGLCEVGGKLLKYDPACITLMTRMKKIEIYLLEHLNEFIGFARKLTETKNKRGRS